MIFSDKFRWVLAMWLLACPDFMCAQSTFWQPSDTLHKGRFTAVIATGSIGFAGSMAVLNQAWYADAPRGSFRFFNDNADWLQMDKAGHATAGYQVARLGYEAVRWTGASEPASIWIGTGYSMLFLLGVEVLDGFSEAWGFSPGDMAANLLGGAAFVGQQFGWGEQRIALKWSYGHSGLAHYRPELLGATPAERALKDYNGQTYWLSASPASFSGKGGFWPDWLNVAFGYSGQGMLGGAYNPAVNAEGLPLPEMERYRQYLLSFDIDLTRIQSNSGFLRTLLSAFGFIKVPAPALEFSRGSLTWHWLYF
jgi:uncharacterized protein YfiM (DUF2279 family)